MDELSAPVLSAAANLLDANGFPEIAGALIAIADGVRPNKAFSRRRGQRAISTVTTLDKRNELIRALRRRHFRQCSSIRAAAKEIDAAAARYRSSQARRLARETGELLPPDRGRPIETFFAIERMGLQVPGEPQLRRILAHEFG